MITIIVIVTALVLDWLIGEPSRYHPLALFGRLADLSEAVSKRTPFDRLTPFVRGLSCWLLLVLPPTCGLWLLIEWLPLHYRLALDCLIVYFTIGWKSMQQHALEVYRLLHTATIAEARESVQKIVSRETGGLDESEIAKGAVEAIVENGSDCVLSPIFWYLLLGAPGALMFRLANTLDAMWGVKTDRYIDFGRSAAKMDDWLNWIPARLTAVGYAICGQFFNAVYCMKNQKAESEGPNAGLVMAAGGGALGIELGGEVIYHGELDQRPILGRGREVEPQDIVRSINLVWRTLALWILVITIGFTLYIWNFSIA